MEENEEITKFISTLESYINQKIYLNKKHKKWKKMKK